MENPGKVPAKVYKLATMECNFTINIQHSCLHSKKGSEVIYSAITIDAAVLVLY